MILLPVLVIGAYALWPPRGTRRLLQCAVFGVAMTAVLMPWIVRNYRYTGTILPTSTHGGIQLWYGTLQTGAYLESRAHNPRSAFASPAFPYTSLEAPIVITGSPGCVADAPARLAYKTSRDTTWRWLDALETEHGRHQFELPAQPIPTTVYYFFELGAESTPPGGADEPLIYFVSDDHVGDLDVHQEMLDIFDIGRLSRHVGAAAPMAGGSKFDLNRDGQIDAEDLWSAIALLLPQWDERRNPVSAVELRGNDVVVQLIDGSRLIVPPAVARQTDFGVSGNLASALVSRSRTLGSIGDTPVRCEFKDIRINDVFYRREPHEMRRYTALAFDNIGRDPMAFVAASAYRMMRLFIIRGTDDRQTTQQFPLSRIIFRAGMLASVLYFALFLAGVVIAWRVRSPFLYALIPIAYVPLTICFVLTNMRYTITVQPLMFVFVAIAVAAALKLGRPATEGSGR
jgi:hypothetical protein